MLKDSDQEASNDIDAGNENARHGVPLSESGRAIHRAVKLRFRRQRFSAVYGLHFRR